MGVVKRNFDFYVNIGQEFNIRLKRCAKDLAQTVFSKIR